MAIINVANLRKLDLNLLVVFHVLMQEQHVTRAAQRLHLSQGAVSAALNRLRTFFQDPLFERSRNGMLPTPVALSLAPQIAQSLAMLDGFVSQTANFDPRTSTRNFHLAMSDDVEAVLVPRIIRMSGRDDWSVRFSFHQTNSLLWEESLSDPKMDLVICSSPSQVPAMYRQTVLSTSSYSCLFDANCSSFSLPITFDEYMQARHIRVSYNAQRAFVDEYFEAHGRHRNAVASLSHFSGIVPALRVGNLVATIPSYAAEALSESTGLAVSPPPIPVPQFTISVLWKISQEIQPDHAWLRSFLESCASGSGLS